MRDLVEIALDRFRENQHSQITKKVFQLAQMGGSSKIKSEPPTRSCLIQAGASLSSDLAPLACVCDQHFQACPKTFRLGSQLEPDAVGNVIGNVIGNVTGVPKGFGSGPPGSQNVTGNVTGVPM